jgi:hypothetical protein
MPGRINNPERERIGVSEKGSDLAQDGSKFALLTAKSRLNARKVQAQQRRRQEAQGIVCLKIGKRYALKPFA